jgi:hypothetical protein
MNLIKNPRDHKPKFTATQHSVVMFTIAIKTVCNCCVAVSMQLATAMALMTSSRHFTLLNGDRSFN